MSTRTPPFVGPEQRTGAPAALLPRSALSHEPVDQLIALRDGEVWVAPRHVAPARLVHCVAGNVWLTQEGSPDDIVIGAGEMRSVPGDGKLVVQALNDAIVTIGH